MTNKLIPREILFGNPDKASVGLSADGKYISYLAPHNGVLNVYVGDINDPHNAKPITNDSKRGIRTYFVAHDNEHIIYMQDDEGDENFHVHVVNIKTKEDRNLTPFKGVRAGISTVSRLFPEDVIITLNKRDPQHMDYYKLNIKSGKLDMIYENSAGYMGLVLDEDYKLRFAMQPTPEGGQNILQFDDVLNTEIFLEISPEDLYTTGPITFNKAKDILYMQDSRGRNTGALTAWDLNTGKQEVIFSDDKSDVGMSMMHPTEKNIQMVASCYDKLKQTVLDKAIQPDIDYLQTLDKGELGINSRSLDDKKWIVTYLHDDKPVSYYLYDREKKKAEFLFTNREDLEKHKLAPMHPVVIKSRDGLDMMSYLTLPLDSVKDKKSQTPDKPVPLILCVHGGPTARDVWGLNNAHQWLSNRGYAVLSVNYRGSTGFGKKFIEQGDGQWSRKMHDDLIDAVDWAIDSKITNKDQVAIFGGSYGGYAALAGLTYTPDVFACAVDIVGPSSLVTLLKSIPPYWKPMYNALLKRIGGDPDTKKGKKFLEECSPLTHHNKIKKPLLIGQGANDPRVKQAESDQIVAAMKEKNIPVTYVLYPDEGHGFARPENRMSFFAVMEQFLAQHLGGKAEPIGDAFKGSSIDIKEALPYVEQICTGVK